jgi:hypothetical protein
MIISPRERVLAQIEHRETGCVLAPARALQPGTPVENAAAVVEPFLQQAGVAFP